MWLLSIQKDCYGYDTIAIVALKDARSRATATVVNGNVAPAVQGFEEYNMNMEPLMILSTS